MNCCATAGSRQSLPKMGPLARALGVILIVTLHRRCYAITKNFVNSSMPEMRPTFVVNFDMATVICQHSADPSDLHLHQMSILCDGKPDCYKNPAMHDESFPYCGWFLLSLLDCPLWLMTNIQVFQ